MPLFNNSFGMLSDTSFLYGINVSHLDVIESAVIIHCVVLYSTDKL